MDSKIQQLENLIKISRDFGSSNPNFKGSEQEVALESFSEEVEKLRSINIETKNRLLSATRYNLDLLDQTKIQIKINDLANRLSNYW